MSADHVQRRGERVEVVERSGSTHSKGKGHTVCVGLGGDAGSSEDGNLGVRNIVRTCGMRG